MPRKTWVERRRHGRPPALASMRPRPDAAENPTTPAAAVRISAWLQ